MVRRIARHVAHSVQKNPSLTDEAQDLVLKRRNETVPPVTALAPEHFV